MKRILLNNKGRFGFSIIGFSITLISVILTIIFYFNPHNEKPKLKFYLGNSYTIARTEKKVDSVTIFYKNRNIAKDSMNLLMTRIRISNKGREIKLDDYSAQPFGLKIYNCKIIDIKVDNKKDLCANENFLTDSLKPRIVDSATIEMNKLPFDKSDEVSFDVCLLYKWNQIPDYYAMGKIIGMKEIPTLLEGEDEYIDWDLIKYIGILLSIEIPVLLGLFFFINLIMKKYRKRQISNLYNSSLKNLTDTQIVFVKIYIVLGKKYFKKLLKGFIEGDSFLNSEKKFIDAFEKINETRKRKLKYLSPFSRSYELLMKKKLIIKNEGGNFIMSQELIDEVKNTLNLFSI